MNYELSFQVSKECKVIIETHLSIVSTIKSRMVFINFLALGHSQCLLVAVSKSGPCFLAIFHMNLSF